MGKFKYIVDENDYIVMKIVGSPDMSDLQDRGLTVIELDEEAPFFEEPDSHNQGRRFVNKYKIVDDKLEMVREETLENISTIPDPVEEYNIYHGIFEFFKTMYREGFTNDDLLNLMRNSRK